MKKILFATTALVATAGVAAADVSFSGYGRMGAVNNFAGVTGVYTRIRLQVDMTTEADNGLEFGARMRHQVTSFNGGWAAGAFSAARFHAKAGGLEVGVGNIQGAIEWMPGIYMNSQSASVGLSGLGFLDTVGGLSGPGFAWDAFSSTGGGAATRQGVEVKYAAGDFGVHLSYSTTAANDRLAAHVSYTFNDWTVALGMQDSTLVAEDMWVVTASGKVGPANLSLGYADVNGTGQITLRGQFEVGAATRIDAYVTSVDVTGEAYGLGVSHSLGGGASLEAGIARNQAGNTAADLGVRFNF
jgi:outer membrane protein OmpU